LGKKLPFLFKKLAETSQKSTNFHIFNFTFAAKKLPMKKRAGLLTIYCTKEAGYHLRA
jgi:hypothetical protein